MINTNSRRVFVRKMISTGIAIGSIFLFGQTSIGWAQSAEGSQALPSLDETISYLNERLCHGDKHFSTTQWLEDIPLGWPDATYRLAKKNSDVFFVAIYEDRKRGHLIPGCRRFHLGKLIIYVRMSLLNPDSVGRDGGGSISVNTTDKKELINIDLRYTPKCPNHPNRKYKTDRIEIYPDPKYWDKNDGKAIINALRHLIRLAGGKTDTRDPFKD